MIVTVEIDRFIIKTKYWPAEPSTGTPADIELLEVSKLYGERKVKLPYERWDEIDERKLFKLVEEALLEESREATGDGFNYYNPATNIWETR